MAQRKPAQNRKSASGKTSGAAKAGAAKAPAKVSTSKVSASTPAASTSTGTKAAAAKAGAAGRGPAGSKGPAQRPPARRGKSIVNQKQTPWGLIASAVAVVVFAAAVVFVVIATRPDSNSGGKTTTGGQAVDASNPYRRPEDAAAAKIKGVTYTVEGQHTHVTGKIKYDSSPPVGGNHNGFWADCSGTVYSKAIANENAVHMLEHGAVWITYNEKTLPASQLDTLKKDVSGIDRMALSPYPNLKTPISLQAWGYQLFVKDAADPRIAAFIAALKYNKNTTPEYGATCVNTAFKNHPSTYGNPEDSA